MANSAAGRGVETRVDGSRYEGDWKDDRPDGFGVESWPDGSKYEGPYKQGMKHCTCGTGTFSWKDGSSYTGEFEKNVI